MSDIIKLIDIANDKKSRLPEILDIMKGLLKDVKPSFFTTMSTNNSQYGDLEEMIVTKHMPAENMSLNINEFAILLIARMCNPYRSQRGETVFFLLTLNAMSILKGVKLSDIIDDDLIKISMDSVRARFTSNDKMVTGVYSWRMAMFLTMLLKDAPEHSPVISMWSLALIS